MEGEGSEAIVVIVVATNPSQWRHPHLSLRIFLIIVEPPLEVIGAIGRKRK